jgi:hypothetical protein
MSSWGSIPRSSGSCEHGPSLGSVFLPKADGAAPVVRRTGRRRSRGCSPGRTPSRAAKEPGGACVGVAWGDHTNPLADTVGGKRPVTSWQARTTLHSAAGAASAHNLCIGAPPAEQRRGLRPSTSPTVICVSALHLLRTGGRICYAVLIAYSRPLARGAEQAVTRAVRQVVAATGRAVERAARAPPPYRIRPDGLEIVHARRVSQTRNRIS